MTHDKMNAADKLKAKELISATLEEVYEVGYRAGLLAAAGICRGVIEEGSDDERGGAAICESRIRAAAGE